MSQLPSPAKGCGQPTTSLSSPNSMDVAHESSSANGNARINWHFMYTCGTSQCTNMYTFIYNMYVQKIHVSGREFRVKKSRPALCRGDDGHENYRPPTRRRTTPPDGGVPPPSFVVYYGMDACMHIYIHI